MGNIKIIDRREDKSEDLPDETKEPSLVSNSVFDLNTRTGSEIINVIAEGNRKNILTGILTAIGKISGIDNITDALKTYNIDQLWELITSPPWIKAYIDPLKKEIVERFRKNPNISINDAISDIHLNFPLKPGFTIVADLNGYSNFQYQATDSQKTALDESYQITMFQLCKKFNVKLLQAPAGDAYVFYVEEHLPAFLKALREVKIKVPLNNPDKKLYPDGNFTFSTGVAKADGDLRLSIYTSPKGTEDGLIDVDGDAYVRAIHGQKNVGKNRLEVDGETKSYLKDLGIILKGYEVKDEDLANVEMPEIKDIKYIKEPGSKYITLIRDCLPDSYKESIALISALAQATHTRGCISTVDNMNRGKEKLPAIDATSIAFQIGSLEDLGMRQERYESVIKKYFKIIKNYPDFFTFKKDGEKLHVHTKLPLNEANGKKILAFCRDMAEMISTEGFKLGIGVGYTESMVRTRVLGSSLEERAGSGIVKSVRLGTESRDLRIDTEFCRKAFGNIFEFDVVRAKGGDIMCLKIDLHDIDPEKISGKELVGVDVEKKEIEDFVSNLGTNGNFLKIYSNLSGTGVSALMRHSLKHATEKGIKASNIEKLGQDSYTLIRGLVCSFYPNIRKDIAEKDLLVKFDELLLDASTLNERNLLVLDIKEINPNERPLFERFAAAIVTTKTGLIHSGDFGGKTIEVKAMTIEDAADMLLDINIIQLDLITDLQPLTLALEKFCEEENFQITPRNLIYILNEALTKEGGRIFFDKSKTKNIRTGEIGRKIREGVSEERQFILGLVASVKLKTSIKILWPIYCNLKNIRQENSEMKKTFSEDLEYLCDKGLLEKIGENYDLKDKNERNSALLLAVKDETEFSRMLIFQNAFEGEEIDSIEAKFQHLLNAGQVNEQSLIKSCSKVAKYYFGQGFVSESRRAYYDYLKKSGLQKIKPENFDFFMDMAQTFHTSDEKQRKIAEEIYATIDSSSSLEGIKLKLIWRKYRLCTLDGKNNAVPGNVVSTLENSFDEKELDGIFEMRERQTIFKKLIAELQTLSISNERDGVIATIEMDNLLRKVYTLRSLKDKRVIEKDELKEYYKKKKTAFKDELDALIKFGSKGSEETQATFLRLCGGTSNQLGDHEAAIKIFDQAGKKFANINPPDLFQTNDTLQGVVEAYDYLCREKANSPESSREETFEMLEGLEERIRKLESSAILSGDMLNRANAMLGYCALCEYKIRAIAKYPNIDSDKELVKETISINEHMANNYVRLKLHHTKGAGEKNIRNENEQIKTELATAVQLLPLELRF